jgi:hypothetical protein
MGLLEDRKDRPGLLGRGRDRREDRRDDRGDRVKTAATVARDPACSASPTAPVGA